MRSRFTIRHSLLIFTLLALGNLSILPSLTIGNSQSALSDPPLPAGPAPDGTFRFVALGDMGTGEKGQYEVARVMEEFRRTRPYETVLLLGDNIYPDGNPSHFREKFEQPYAKLIQSGVSFHAVLGNHDVRKGREAELAYEPFHMDGRSYYSFSRGGDLVEFFALDSTDFSERQLRWVDDALTASKARWKIAFFHHPIYSSAGTHGSERKLREKLEPLFVKHGIAAALSGHDHTYERVKPQRGVHYFVSGTGGQLRRGDLNRKSPIFAAGHDQSNGFIFLELDREELRFWSISVTEGVVDSGRISRR